MPYNVTYTFYVEVNADPQESLTPEFELMVDISDNSIVDTSTLTIQELQGGFYKFVYSWDETSSSEGYLIKINTGTTSEVGRIITMRIEPQDYLPQLTEAIRSIATNIESSANNLESSSTNIDEFAKRLLDIEQGTWIIENDILKLYSAGYGSAVGTLIAEYYLRDANDIATSVNPFKRVLKTLVGTVTP